MGRRIDENWQPEPGDDLTGRITDAMVVVGTRYGDIDVAVVTDAETGIKYGVWLSRTVLKRVFEEKRPALGALIYIGYVGPETAKGSGYTYHVYQIGCADRLEVTGRDWIEDFVDEARKSRRAS